MRDKSIFLPDPDYYKELIRPWKLISFAAAMAWLLYGAINFGIGDWDVGVTLLMGGLTYLMSPWSVSLIIKGVRERSSVCYLQILWALIMALFVVDWSYLLYHALLNNPIYREANIYASTPLYFMAGCFWLYRGSLNAFLANLKRLVS